MRCLKDGVFNYFHFQFFHFIAGLLSTLQSAVNSVMPNYRAISTSSFSTSSIDSLARCVSSSHVMTSTRNM